MVHVWLYDGNGNVEFLHGKHLILFAISRFNLGDTAVHSGPYIAPHSGYNILNLCTSSTIKLKPFLDA